MYLVAVGVGVLPSEFGLAVACVVWLVAGFVLLFIFVCFCVWGFGIVYTAWVGLDRLVVGWGVYGLVKVCLEVSAASLRFVVCLAMVWCL